MPTLTETSHLERLKIYNSRDPAAVRLAANQLAALGHAAFANVFSPEAVARAKQQIPKVFPAVYWTNHGGREVAIRTDGLGLRSPQDDSGFGEIHGGISRTLNSLGRTFALNTTANSQPYDRLAVVPSGHPSFRHGLRKGQGPVLAVTTLEGEAQLVVDHPILDKAYYPLVPGIVTVIYGKQQFHEVAQGGGDWLGYFVTEQAPDRAF